MTTHARAATGSPSVSATGTKRGIVIAALAGILYPVPSVGGVPLTGEPGLPTWEGCRGPTAKPSWPYRTRRLRSGHSAERETLG